MNEFRAIAVDIEHASWERTQFSWGVSKFVGVCFDPVEFGKPAHVFSKPEGALAASSCHDFPFRIGGETKAWLTQI